MGDIRRDRAGSKPRGPSRTGGTPGRSTEARRVTADRKPGERPKTGVTTEGTDTPGALEESAPARRTSPADRDIPGGGGLPRGPQALPREQVAEHQRERLFKAMVECVNEHGFAGSTISELVSHARISRRSFYEHFNNKDECLLATYDAVIQRLGRRLRDAQVSTGEWEDELEAFIRALFDAAGDRPDAAKLVCVEMAAAGPAGVQRWADEAERLQRFIVGVFTRAPGPGTVPDPVARAIVGALRRILYTRVRSARSSKLLKAELAGLVPDLLAWIACYYPSPEGVPLHPRALAPGTRALGVRIGGRAPGTLTAPPLLGGRGLPRGEHNLPHGFVVYNQRERIFDAIANLTAAHGYPALSLNDIAAEAAVSLQTFYTHFDNKQDAFIATYEAGHARAMAVINQTLARQSSWIGAMRAGVAALLELLASEPSYAHLACVDVMVAYPHMAQRAHEANDFYAGLLDLRIAADSPSLLPSPVVGEAIVGGVYELFHDYVLRGQTRRLPELTDHVMYIALAPFMGARDAWRAIAEG